MPDGRNIDEAQKWQFLRLKIGWNGQIKTALAAKPSKFFKIVLNFVLIGDEVKHLVNNFLGLMPYRNNTAALVQKWLILEQKCPDENSFGGKSCKLFLKLFWFLCSWGGTSKFLEKRFSWPAPNRRNIGDLVQKLGHKIVYLCQTAQNGLIPIFLV